MKPWLCKQEPDYKLLQFWCKAWMGGLFPPSVLLIDDLPLKPSLHKSGGSVNAGAPEYCLTDGDTHFSSRDFPYIAPFISEGVFQYHPCNAMPAWE